MKKPFQTLAALSLVALTVTGCDNKEEACRLAKEVRDPVRRLHELLVDASNNPDQIVETWAVYCNEIERKSFPGSLASYKKNEFRTQMMKLNTNPAAASTRAERRRAELLSFHYTQAKENRFKRASANNNKKSTERARDHIVAMTAAETMINVFLHRLDFEPYVDRFGNDHAPLCVHIQRVTDPDRDGHSGDASQGLSAIDLIQPMRHDPAWTEYLKGETLALIDIIDGDDGIEGSLNYLLGEFCTVPEKTLAGVGTGSDATDSSGAVSAAPIEAPIEPGVLGSKKAI